MEFSQVPKPKMPLYGCMTKAKRPPVSVGLVVFISTDPVDRVLRAEWQYPNLVVTYRNHLGMSKASDLRNKRGELNSRLCG